MADVNKLAPFILQWEGGFVNDPDDLGGATNKGITLSTYESFCRRKGYPKPTVERLKNISQTDWIEILKTMYWDKWKADQIMNQSVLRKLSLSLYDSSLNVPHVRQKYQTNHIITKALLQYMDDLLR